MPRLSRLELRIVRSLLIRDFGPMTPIVDQVASLEFEERRMTGTGYYAAFLNAKQFPRLDQLDTELSQDLPTSLEPPADLVAFTLFVRDGYLSSFEGYTFGDVPWPSRPMEDWLLVDEAAQRGCQKVE
jgi:hypothetical protein